MKQTQKQNNTIYLFQGHKEQIKSIYLSDIDLVKNTKGRNMIPCMGTDYVSTEVFKLFGKRIGFYGIANKRLEVFEVDLPALFKQ